MTTDFCMETLLATQLQSICSDTSLTDTTSSSKTDSPQCDITTSQEQSITNCHTVSPLSASPQPSGAKVVLAESQEEPKNNPKKKGTKRKRDDGDDQNQSAATVTSSTKKKTKRVRTAYTRAQLCQLEAIFSRSQYPDMLTRQTIAEQMGLEEKKIHVWFQNRRAKHRKHCVSGTQSPSTALSLPLTQFNPAMMSAFVSGHISQPTVSVPTHSPPHTDSVTSANVTPSQSLTSISSVSKVSPPSVSHLPAYFPLRSHRPAMIPTTVHSTSTTAVPTPYHPVAVSSGSTSPQLQPIRMAYNPYEFVRVIPSTVMPSEVCESSSPEQLRLSSTYPRPLLSSDLGLFTTAHSNQATPQFSVRPSTVHLIRRSCSPESSRSSSLSPQVSVGATPTLSHYLRTPSPQVNGASSPLQLTPSSHIGNYSSDIVVLPASYAASQQTVDYSKLYSSVCSSNGGNSFRVL